MSAKLSQDGTSTKDFILRTAFSFYEETMTKDFSMNELAQKAGISKPAIYRHFKNKEAVLFAMRSHLFSLVASKINEIQLEKNFSKEEREKKLMITLVVLFADNPHLINYFICQVTQDSHFLLIMQEELFARGVRKDFDFYQKSRNRTYFCAHDYFFGISILFFIKVREKKIKELGQVKDSYYFASRLYDFLHSGIRGFTKPGDVFYSVEISEERMAELDEICFVKPEYLPEDNKILAALANVIKKFTANGVTIERIAKELGMAKSSLYFYFENKNQMIYSLVEKEITFLETLCRENCVEAKNLSEFIYISMFTEISFFLIRPALLSICGWLMQTSTDEPFGKNHDKQNENLVWDNCLEKFAKNVDLGFELNPEVLRIWTGILPVAITVLKSQNGFSDEKIIEAVKYVFGFVENGILSDKKV